jgi:glutathione S-transferase
MRGSVLYPQGQAQWYDLKGFPALQDMACRVEQTPATTALVLAEGLGETPFTRPAYARPSVGSAT